MAKIHVANEVAKGYLETTVSLEELQNIKRYAPKALQVFEEKEEVFRVMPGTKGSISAAGICFAEETADKKAKVVFEMPEAGMKAEDINAYIMDKYNEAILNLRKVETQIAAATETVAAMKKDIADNIKIG
ncbi:MAG: hypothetical protein PUF04_09580 [bacterium]|nr:hypothetical protein [bacterium]